MPVIRQRGDRWQAIVRVTVNGTKLQAAQSHSTKLLAEDWARRKERELRRLSAPVRTDVTLSGLIEAYIKAREEAKPLGRSTLGDLDLIERSLGSVRVDALTPKHWSDFARKRRAEGAGPATVKHNLATARVLLSAARPVLGIHVDESSVTDAIAALHSTGHISKSNERHRRPTQDELRALRSEFERLQHHPSTQIPMHQYLDLAVALPRRREELCSALWTNYTGTILTLVDTKHPRVPRTERVPVPKAARDVIAALPRIDARIFPYKPESVSASFQRACNRLGIEDLTLHDLRHEGICRLFEAGLGIPEVSLISGHMSWQTLKRYTHLRPENVLEKLDAGSQAVQEPDTESEKP